MSSIQDNPEIAKPPVFITGVTGFIGSELAKRFVAEGREVRSITTNPDHEPQAGVEFAVADITDPESKYTIQDLMDDCSTVYHCAGVNEFCSKNPGRMFDVNVNGTKRVIATATMKPCVKRVINLSSAVTIGEAKGEVANENTPRSRTYLSKYERTKSFGEHYGAFAAYAGTVVAESDIELITLNPASVQGPGRASGTARMIIKALNGERQYLPANSVISIVDIRDCIDALVASETQGTDGERYIISGFQTSFKNAVTTIEEISGRPSNVKFVSDRKLNALGSIDSFIRTMAKKPVKNCPEFRRTLLHGAIYDGSKATRELGIEYRSKEETFRDTINWLIEKGLAKS